MPKELVGKASHTPGGKKKICWDYNTCGCSRAGPGGECDYGVHVCAEQGCAKAHPIFEHR